MPFRSERQRRYLFANEPEVAHRWADKYGIKVRRKRAGVARRPMVKVGSKPAPRG